MNHEQENHGCDPAGCPVIGYQEVDVCVPVVIKPFGEVGNAHTRCIGEPEVRSGDPVAKGKTDAVCCFTVSQKLRVEVPVIFGARAEVGEASVDCGCAEEKEHCKNSEYRD